ncbi:hypothetical protein [Sulfurimonas sp. ST-27]|uniref:hypothetical protein n=1 Tax=Sulfurimonas sp. ST-27 TaxID=3400152 RepID=UPI003AB2CC93
MNTTEEKISLKQQINNLKMSKRRVTDFYNSIINISQMGKEVFNSKNVKNIFTLNHIDESIKNSADMQKEYLAVLLKAGTPNYKVDAPNFQFNSKERVSWIILEFDVQTNLSENENIRYTREYIESEIGLEPTLIAIEEYYKVLVGYFFPNAPTTLQIKRLKKYNYFKDVRTALTHSLEANWDVTVDKYNETKRYSNFLQNAFYLSGNIFEIGVFQEMLNTYKDSPMFEKIIKQKKAYGGQKSGITKRAMTETERRSLLNSAREKRSLLSKYKFQDTIEHIRRTENIPKFTISNIVKVSKELFDRGLSHRTVAKYLKDFKYTTFKS